jgi:hypothetical protein
MIKDLAWVCDWFYCGVVAGSLTMLWSVFLLARTFAVKNYVETWHYFAQFLWLGGNFWWMWGELHDAQYPHATPIYDRNQQQTGYLMIGAFCFLSVYYVIVRPCKLLKVSPAALAAYDETGMDQHWFLRCCCPRWRQYENCHIFFWLVRFWRADRLDLFV